jgi:uncharacterized membrane protein
MRPATLSPIRAILAAAAIVGSFDATFLTLSHLWGRDLPCGPLAGCHAVEHDAWSAVWGVPVAAFGLAAYLALLARVLLAPSFQSRALDAAGLVLSAVGFAVSTALTLRAVFFIHALCVWCLVSFGCMTVSLVGNLIWLLKPPTQAPHPKFRLVSTSAVSIALALATFVAARLNPVPSLQKTREALAAIPTKRLLAWPEQTFGPPDAPIKLVEFADFCCSACREMHGRIERLMGHHPGRFSLEFLNRPVSGIPGHEASLQLAIFGAVCARHGQFKAFVDRAYSTTHPPTVQELREFTRSVAGAGFDAEFEAVKPGVRRQSELADRLAVVATPTFVILDTQGNRDTATSADLATVLSTPRYQRILFAQNPEPAKSRDPKALTKS